MRSVDSKLWPFGHSSPREPGVLHTGHTPTTKFLKTSGLEFDESGYIALKSRSSYTNIPGVFAAGDVADGQYRQAVTAAGMGCQAALDAERWLAAEGVH